MVEPQGVDMHRSINDKRKTLNVLSAPWVLKHNDGITITSSSTIT